MSRLAAAWRALEKRTAAHCRFIAAAAAAASGGGPPARAGMRAGIQQCCDALLQALLARRGGARPTATDPTTAPGQARTQGEGEWGGGRTGWAVRVKHPAVRAARGG